MEEKEMNEFVAIFNLMKQAPEFSVVIFSILFYLIYDKNKSFFLLRDNKHKETMENFFSQKIKDMENRLQENMKHFTIEQNSLLEIRIKDYIDHKFKDFKNGL